MANSVEIKNIYIKKKERKREKYFFKPTRYGTTSLTVITKTFASVQILAVLLFPAIIRRKNKSDDNLPLCGHP